MITLEELRQLVALEEYGTLSAAAEALHISQPSLTRTMKRLEEELRVPLFERRKNKLTPNDTGRLMMEKARGILSQMDSMVVAVRAFDRQMRTLSIGSIAPLPMWHIQRALSEACPEKTISAEMRGEEELVTGLLNGSYHVVVLSKTIEDERLCCKKLFEEHLYFSLPKQHPRAGAKTLSFKDMDGAMMIVSSNTGFWHDIHMKKMPHTRFLMQDEYETFRELVHASSLPSFVTDQVMRLEKLPEDRVAVPISNPEAGVSYYVVVAVDKQSLMSLFSL